MDNETVKPIIALLTASAALRDDVVRALEEHLGDADFVGPWHPFKHTNYYETEMGKDLNRCIISFERTVSAAKLPKLKSLTREIEAGYRMDGNRTVNIDPGYVDLHKVVLGSGKGGGHMLLVGDGVFADILLYYNKGWQPMPWAYPDFKNGTYVADLGLIRQLFKTRSQKTKATS